MFVKLFKDSQYGEETLTETHISGAIPRVSEHLRFRDRLYEVTKVTHDFPDPSVEVVVKLV